MITVETDRTGRISSGLMADSLRRFGVSDDALHVVSRDNPGYLNDAFRQTKRPVVCLVDSELEIDGKERFETLLRSMVESDADLAVPIQASAKRVELGKPLDASGMRSNRTA